MIPAIGAPAPDFELTWRVGEPPIRRSSWQEGRPLVLLFYPLAFSPVCTDELCAVRDDGSRWEHLDARILGVSVDSPWVNARFADELGVEFPLLSDFNREVAAAYGVLNDDYWGMRGVSDRAVFVIDAAGAVVWAWHSPDDSVLPDLGDIQAAVKRASATPRTGASEGG